MHRLAILLVLIASSVPLLSACSQQKVVEKPPAAAMPDHSRPLPPGQSALRLVTDPGCMPDLAGAYANRDVLLTAAIDQSLTWFAAPSSRQFFPFESFTHEQARAGLFAFRDLLEGAADATAFQADVLRMFDVYESVGYDGQGIVLFTGYYSPIFPAARTRTERFTEPLYRRPADLVTDPITGEPQGRRTADGRIVPYYTRREIEESRMFAGNELVWLEDALSAYIIHVNGSAKLRLPDETVMYIGYNGKTGREYASLREEMVKAGVIDADAVSLAAIRRVYRAKPQAVEELMNRNENYVFFTEYDGARWPSGSLGVKVTAENSLATDKKIYPRGGVVLVDTHTVTFSSGSRRFLRFMLDQDTGGAIRAPGRADIFMGIGRAAEVLAGGQAAEGRLYYLFLKPQYLPQYAKVLVRRPGNLK